LSPVHVLDVNVEPANFSHEIVFPFGAKADCLRGQLKRKALSKDCRFQTSNVLLNWPGV
jgi:hypothetical protein